jgi:hypothetical protein
MLFVVKGLLPMKNLIESIWFQMLVSRLASHSIRFLLKIRCLVWLKKP